MALRRHRFHSDAHRQAGHRHRGRGARQRTRTTAHNQRFRRLSGRCLRVSGQRPVQAARTGAVAGVPVDGIHFGGRIRAFVKGVSCSTLRRDTPTRCGLDSARDGEVFGNIPVDTHVQGSSSVTRVSRSFTDGGSESDNCVLPDTEPYSSRSERSSWRNARRRSKSLRTVAASRRQSVIGLRRRSRRWTARSALRVCSICESHPPSSRTTGGST